MPNQLDTAALKTSLQAIFEDLDENKTAAIAADDIVDALDAALENEPTAGMPANLEMELEFKSANLTNYKTYGYTLGKLTLVEVWETSGMLTKLFSKTLAYTGTLLTTTVLTRVSDSATLTRTYAYSGSTLTSVTTS